MKEMKNLLDDSSKPGDITLPLGWHRCQGLPTAFDVTVTSPLQKAFISRTTSEPYIALEKAAERKKLKAQAACTERGLAFVPLPVSTLGAWEPGAAEHIRDFARFQAARSGHNKGLTIRHLFERLSVLIQRGNANLLIARSPFTNSQPHVDGHR